jgi:hypothetical protein
VHLVRISVIVTVLGVVVFVKAPEMGLGVSTTANINL